jgi:hypothetical protein
MMPKSIFKLSPIACTAALLSVYALPSFGQNAADAPKTVFPDTIQFPSIEAAGPSTFIKFRFPGKENAQRIDIVEHLNERVYRLFENGEVLYGLYSFSGNPVKDEKFRAYYMNFPRDAVDPTIFEFDFDNKDKKFKLRMVMPDGKEIFSSGSFELAADIKR